MLLWFVAIGLLGLRGIVRAPEILGALSPHHAVSFLVHAGPGIGFAVLGAAFLAVTGAEAMYADMGHFGRLPVRLGWFVVVLPALMLNYFGQGALLLSDPGAIENPFYRLVPRWAHYPMVAFAARRRHAVFSFYQSFRGQAAIIAPVRRDAPDRTFS
jgi:KUP system potassium uptake protein